MAKVARRPQNAPAKRKLVHKQAGTQSGDIQSVVAKLTVPGLDALIKAATERRNQQLAVERASFLNEVKAKAASLGIPLSDLLGGARKRGGSGDARAISANRDWAAAARPPVAVKYRNPATGETWSGRGRPARWLTQLEAQGRKREEFAV